MGVEGRDFLEVAQQLGRGRPPAERNLRTAVNRAYYAAFSEAVSYLGPRGYVRLGRGASHQRVWAYLKIQVPDSDVRRRAIRSALADEGLELLRRRTLADYNLKGRLARDDPGFSIKSAEKMIDRLDRLRA